MHLVIFNVDSNLTKLPQFYLKAGNTPKLAPIIFQSPKVTIKKAVDDNAQFTRNNNYQ